MATVSLPGLASGFPTQTYIETVMKAEKVPYNKLNEKKEINTAYKNVFSSLNTKLNSLKDAAVALRDVGSFSINTATVSDATKMSITAGDNALAGDYSVKVNNLAKQGVYQSSALTKDASVNNLVGKKVQLKVSDSEIKEFELKGNDINEVLSNLVKDINGNPESGISASIVQTSSSQQRLILTSKETGVAHEINFMDSVDVSTLTADDKKQLLATTDDHPVIFMSADVKSELGFDAANAHVQSAMDASLEINGVSITSASNSVKDAIVGVTMQLTATGESTVKVKQDADKITSKVETFVKAYNDIISTIKANTPKSQKNSDGSLSLTLQSDSTLRTLRNSLGDWMNSIVGDTTGFKLLSDIGLEVDKGVTSASLMTGQITFDKEKFKEKLAADPEAVAKMFNAAPVTDGSGDTTFAGGIGYMFENNLKPWTQSGDGFMASRISAYDSDIKFLTKQMEDMDIRLNKRQASLERKFVNLEKSMSILNNQLSWMKTQVNNSTSSSSKS